VNLTTIEKRILANRYAWTHRPGETITVKPHQRPITEKQRRTAQEHLFSLGLIGDDCSLTEEGRRQAIRLLTVRDWQP
jgi:hypothetical protein